ncbi:unnamed protein product [Spirodela intermedia]|uniref:Uncharacterized protein n=1 Tax=Spirodela intermedia TaxID=51605 RepID=A0A7I8JWA2_SPIIN|nr:unnamed protein product [Spirodela intermedia]
MGLGRRGPSDEERPSSRSRSKSEEEEGSVSSSEGDGETERSLGYLPRFWFGEPSSELWKKVFSGIALAGRKPPETKAKLALAGTRARDSFRVGSFRLI